MATTDYATLAEAKAWLGITGTNQDAILPTAITAASRAIDQYTGRRFWLDDAVSTRVLSADNSRLVWVPDIATTTGLVVKTDETDDGNYDTTWTSGSRQGYGYRLWPTNALAETEAAGQRPYTAIESISAEFPMWVEAVQVTAKFGWPAVPGDIHQGCLMYASRMWKRKDAILGVAGGTDVGFVELARRMDPDIRRMLAPYVRPEAKAL